MEIKKYMYNLRKQIREGDYSPETREKLAYARAYMQGEEAVDRLRDRWIEAEIRKKYGTDGAETRIVCNMLKDPTNAKYISEFEAHEAYVSECKAKVDVELESQKTELEKIINDIVY